MNNYQVDKRFKQINLFLLLTIFFSAKLLLHINNYYGKWYNLILFLQTNPCSRNQ